MQSRATAIIAFILIAGCGRAFGSPEAEAVVKVAEATLQDVRENTDFLATLWKWTTIIAGIAAAVIGAFGIKSVRDLSKAKDATLEVAKITNEFRIKMQDDIEKLSKGITSNHLVMMNCWSLQKDVDDIESERTKLGSTAQDKAAFEKREADTYSRVVKELTQILHAHNPQDSGVSSFAYDFLGLAQFKTRSVSAALMSVRKALEFKENNATALYNAACYAATLHLIEVSVGFLARAIEQDQDFLSSAKSDPDFDPIRGSAKFTSVVGI